MTHTFLVVIHLCISVSIYFVISITILVIKSALVFILQHIFSVSLCGYQEEPELFLQCLHSSC